MNRLTCAEPVVAFADGCSLLVIIVSYRTARLSIDSLRALEQEVGERNAAGAKTRVVVVDNDSGDQSDTQIAAAIESNGWQSWALLVASKHNGGYAFGNNLAVRASLQSRQSPAYFLLLNPDTQVRPGALGALVEFMEQRPKVGIAGSSLENVDGSRWPIAFRFPTVLSELEGGLRLGLASKLLDKWVVPRNMGNEPEQVDWLPGASMLIRRQVFETIGLMDEAYFLYYEETDFCLQARRAGWTCWYVPKSRVMHVAGQSTGVTDRHAAPKRRPQYLFDSRRRYFVKNHGVAYAALADLAFTTAFAAWRARRIIQRKPDTDPPYLLSDSLRNNVLVKLRDKAR
jgi:N-acetylglucosaminyl-diphospho-decaprenol L-rhamnosyltransferase